MFCIKTVSRTEDLQTALLTNKNLKKSDIVFKQTGFYEQFQSAFAKHLFILSFLNANFKSKAPKNPI